MDHAPLAFGLREHLSHGFQHTQALVADDEFDPVQATASEPLEEADPTGLTRVVLFSVESFIILPPRFDDECL